MRYFETRLAAHCIRGGGRLAAALILLASALWIVGCGGGSGTVGAGPGTRATGRLALTVQWPAPGRLVPSASKSIKAVLKSGDSVIGQTLLVRPSAPPWTSVAAFDNLAAGPVTLTATAYPNDNGSGTAQATGSAPAVIVLGKQASVTVTMASTIDHLAITPDSLHINVGAIQTLMMTAYDLQGNVVLTAPQKVRWSSDTPAHVTIDTNGSISGVTAGQSLITVSESETGKSATTTVTAVQPVSTPQTGPLRSVVDPGGKFLYVADSDAKQIRPFAIGPDGALSPISNATITLSKPPNAMKIVRTGAGSYLYVTASDSVGSQIFFFMIQPDGTLVVPFPGSYVAPRGPIALVSNSMSKYLYLIDHDSGIRCYIVNPNGTLVQNGNDFSVSGHQLFAGVVSSDDKFLFVSAGQGGGLQTLNIQPDGTLSMGTQVNSFANAFSISPTAPYLYENIDTGLRVYQIKTDGSLTKVGADVPFSQYSFASVVSPDGKYLYAVALNAPDNQVAQYAIHADGTLAPLSPATVPAGSYTTSVTVSPDGKYLYVTNNKGGTVSQYRINPDGTLTPLSPANVPG